MTKRLPPSEKWDARFLALARHVGGWSKDEGRPVGAVVVRPDRTIASVGFNGFPRGVDDDPKLYADRAVKILRIVHAEGNAILNAHERLDDCTIYIDGLPPCAACAGLIVQAGITRVVTGPVEVPLRWHASMKEAIEMFFEAGVEYRCPVRWRNE